jgi:hypothetical protein
MGASFKVGERYRFYVRMPFVADGAINGELCDASGEDLTLAGNGLQGSASLVPGSEKPEVGYSIQTNGWMVGSEISFDIAFRCGHCEYVAGAHTVTWEGSVHATGRHGLK